VTSHIHDTLHADYYYCIAVVAVVLDHDLGLGRVLGLVVQLADDVAADADVVGFVGVDNIVAVAAAVVDELVLEQVFDFELAVVCAGYCHCCCCSQSADVVD
jgi:hypothetical protein